MTIRVCAASIGLWSRSMGVGKHAGRARESPRSSSFLNGRFFSREFYIEMQPAAGALSGNRQASVFLWKFNKKSFFKKWVRSRKFYNFNAIYFDLDKIRWFGISRVGCVKQKHKFNIWRYYREEILEEIEVSKFGKQSRQIFLWIILKRNKHLNIPEKRYHVCHSKKQDFQNYKTSFTSVNERQSSTAFIWKRKQIFRRDTRTRKHALRYVERKRKFQSCLEINLVFFISIKWWVTNVAMRLL